MASFWIVHLVLRHNKRHGFLTSYLLNDQFEMNLFIGKEPPRIFFHIRLFIVLIFEETIFKSRGTGTGRYHECGKGQATFEISTPCVSFGRSNYVQHNVYA